MQSQHQKPLAYLGRTLSSCSLRAVVFGTWQATAAAVTLAKVALAIAYSFCASETEDIG